MSPPFSKRPIRRAPRIQPATGGDRAAGCPPCEPPAGVHGAVTIRRRRIPSLQRGRDAEAATISSEDIMIRTVKASAVIALGCTVAGAGLAGCAYDAGAVAKPLASATVRKADKGLLSGTQKIKIDGRSVNVSCSGRLAKGRPVVVLLPGLGDGLDKMAAIQRPLGESDRVCAYDRLGEGASDQPDGPQDFSSIGKTLTAVLDRGAGDRPVVLAGHSLGGMIAGRYAPRHRDRVKGLVLLGAASPTKGRAPPGISRSR